VPTDRLYTVKEIAKQLGVHKGNIDNLVYSLKIKPIVKYNKSLTPVRYFTLRQCYRISDRMRIIYPYSHYKAVEAVFCDGLSKNEAQRISGLSQAKLTKILEAYEKDGFVIVESKLNTTF